MVASGDQQRGRHPPFRGIIPALTLALAVIWLPAGLAACQGAQESHPAAENNNSWEEDRASVDRITYVNSAGDIYTIKADGSEPHRLTGGTLVQQGSTGRFMAQGMDFDSAYAWPTWSPDGTSLAASRVRLVGSQDAELTIEVLDSVTGRSRTVFSNDFPGLVAEGSPHYLYWSPDSKALSFLASTPEGLGLFIVNTQSAAAPILLERGAPLYYSWAGDGGSLVAHIGEEVKLYREVSDHAGGEVLARAQRFRAPAFSPDSKRVAYSGPSGSGEALLVAEVNRLGDARQVLELGAFSAFSWSPNGRELAVADQEDPRSPVFERLRVVSLDESQTGSPVRTIAQHPLLSFYWSPNGERLAWVAVNREDRTFQWRVAPSTSTGADQGRALFTFNPSRDFLTMLSYFDQYAYSHTPWSPDSTRLVVAGGQVAHFERRNGDTPTGSRVYVIDAVGDTPAREIAEGSLAFWSWN